jgi:hypothetical protein
MSTWHLRGELTELSCFGCKMVVDDADHVLSCVLLLPIATLNTANATRSFVTLG